ncbi:uncharacterized protein LOC131637715 [Vicia villosa]|uniref:uncharacterized protein LOC131637715 n=1 Tax=Vicia villosa TaxID=3911 RepID=UPI00273AC078|nr:uncharacterized protein LOC131637715 [Vicia villosa]
MSQHSTSSHLKTSFDEESMAAFVSKAQPVNASVDDVITATPLAMVYHSDIALKKSHPSHTTGFAEPPKGNSSNPALDKIKEGSGYVNRAIRKMVSRILNEEVPVARIFLPLSQIVPSTNDDKVKQTTNVSKNDDPENNLHKFDDSMLKTTETSDDEVIKSVNSGIAKRPRTRKGISTLDPNSPKSNKKQVVGPSKSWSKVNVPSKKRKIMPDTESENVGDDVQDIGDDVQNITHVKKYVTMRSFVNVLDAPLDNISFHSINSVEGWRFMYQRRVVLERELGQDTLKIKEIMELISDVGLMKTVTHFAKFYEVLVKEFIVNIPVDCADPGSQNFRKIYVRGRCVNFSPIVINRYLGRNKEEGCDLEVTDNQVCKVITANQVTTWPMRGKLSPGQLSVKYAILHRIGIANWVPTNHTSIVAVGLGKFLYAVGTKTNLDYGTYIFYQTMRHAATSATKILIGVSSLICGVILNQHPGILSSTDIACKRESVLSLHENLFAGKHVGIY